MLGASLRKTSVCPKCHQLNNLKGIQPSTGDPGELQRKLILIFAYYIYIAMTRLIHQYNAQVRQYDARCAKISDLCNCNRNAHLRMFQMCKNDNSI